MIKSLICLLYKTNLQAAVDFWCDTLDASEFVLSIIKNGYRLPFAVYPSRCFFAQ